MALPLSGKEAEINSAGNLNNNSEPAYLHLIGDCVYKLLFLGHRSLIKNKTQTAVINIVNKRILINLTFRTLVNIHFQKYKPLQYLKTVYIVYNKGLEPRLRKTLFTVI